MDGQNQNQPAQVVVTLPQALSPFPIALSLTRSIDLNDVGMFEMVTFDRLDDKGKPTGEKYDAPCIYRKGINEPTELTEAEAEMFKPFWNLLISNAQYQFSIMQQIVPPPAESNAAPADAKQLTA